MLEIATLTAALLPLLHKALPYLLNLGGKAAEEAAKHMGEDSWNAAKKAWDKIRGRSADAPGLEAAAQETAADQSDESARQLFDLQLTRLLKKDTDLAGELATIMSGVTQNYQVRGDHNHMVGGNETHNMDFRKSHFHAGVLANSVVHGPVDLSVNKAPTVQELEQKEEKKKILDLLSQFDRKAINDYMHEEHIAFMVKSLHELRISLQQMGASTVADPEIKLLFSLMKTDIEHIVMLTKYIHEATQRTDGRASIYDVRSFGMGLQDPSIYAYYNRSLGEQWYNRIFQFVRGRFAAKYEHAKNIDYSKVPRNWTEMLKAAEERGLEPTGIDELIISELTANIPLDVDQISADASILYLFGMIDQLKDSITTKAGMVSRMIRQTS